MDEFISLITRFYIDGFRAKNPFNTPLPPFFNNLFGYESSNGIILIPNGWWEIKQTELEDAFIYLEKISELPIKSNIQIDTRNLHIELYKDNPSTVSIPLQIEGSDNPIVSITLNAPNGFYISPIHITQNLKDPINFQMRKTDSSKLADIYYIELSISYASILIFKGEIPFKVVAVSNLQIQLYHHPDVSNPIIPGDFFTAFSINNLGTIPEFIKIMLDGSAETFIDKTIYPSDFDENDQIFMMQPGILREGVRFLIPRQYTVNPGIYSYNAQILDYIVGTEFQSFSKDFFVGEFYDILFANTSNLDLRVSDSNPILYNLKLQNLGNVLQTFSINYEGLSIATGGFNKNHVSLSPGEITIIQLSLNPLTWGTEQFNIQISSQYNSTELHGSLSIYDDDTHAPILSNLQITDTSTEVRINFNILNENEGDDRGVAEIKIFIDNQQVVFNRPNPSQTSFNYILSNGYMMQYSTHDVKIEVVDNDNDVSNDAMVSITTGSFERSVLDMKDYIQYEIDNLQQYITDEVCFLIGWDLWLDLNTVQCSLDSSYNLYHGGCTNLALLFNSFNQVMLDITDCEVEFWNCLWLISDTDANYIQSDIHAIKEDVILLMGAYVGTELAIGVSNQEVRVNHLADWVEDQSNYNLDPIGDMLEAIKWALESNLFLHNNNFRSNFNLYVNIFVSCGIDTNLYYNLPVQTQSSAIDCELSIIQQMLDSTICLTQQKYASNKITYTQYSTIISECNSIIVALENIKNEL
jgi:hypothetical protein